MNTFLLTPEIQEYIKSHRKEDVVRLILKGSPFKNVSAKELAEQIEGRQKVEKKLPSWFATPNILYPPVLNLAQSSSEITARYKAGLISGERLIDITGGFGADAYFFSRSFQHVIHCEQDRELSAIAAHNIKQLDPGCPIEVVHADSIKYLKEFSGSIDWIYADPGRRSKTGRKLYRLEESIPNILNYMELLFQKAPSVLLKTSPLLDLTRGKSQLKSVSAIHVVAVKNEVKELLWVLRPKAKNPIPIRTVNFTSHGNQYLNAVWGQEDSKSGSFSPPLRYLYEPNAAILKAGLFNTVASRYPVYKLAPNTHLYTSRELIRFPGRRFEILEVLPFKKTKIKLMELRKANITTRNFPVSVREIRKKYKFREGGKEYLFFTQTSKNEKIIIRCHKIQRSHH